MDQRRIAVARRIRILLPALVLGLIACGQPDPEPTAGPAPTTPPGGGPMTVSRLILAADSLVGETVRVQGVCVGWRGPVGGPPPVSRSDWQLQEDSVAIWVSGSLPAGCDPVNPPADLEVEIIALVAVDTISGPGIGEGVVRPYLKRR